MAAWSRIRRHLTYANVLATISAFAVLAGGAAYAAKQLPKKSVGAKQLKANAVITAKIKKNAVTAAKIRAGAVNGAKVRDGSLTAADMQLAGAPYTRIVEELRFNAGISSEAGVEPTISPLPNVGYTQEAGRTDTFAGFVDVAIPSSCTGRRVAIVYLLSDLPPGTKLGPLVLSHVAAVGYFESQGSAAVTGRLNLGPLEGSGSYFAPATAQTHSFSMVLVGACESGGGTFTAGNGGLDVIGTK